jgi:hypothetical protein
MLTYDKYGGSASTSHAFLLSNILHVQASHLLCVLPASVLLSRILLPVLLLHTDNRTCGFSDDTGALRVDSGDEEDWKSMVQVEHFSRMRNQRREVKA